MYRLLTILISFLFTAHAMRASVAIPYVFVKNYTVDDYKASCQNWGFSLTPDGMLYVANNSGLLAFDGNTWKLYSLPGAEVKRLDKLPNFEITEILLSDCLPDKLTYPDIQPELYEHTQGWLNLMSSPDELWDVYDADRNLKGRLHKRGEALDEGDYHLTVQVFVRRSDGQFLLTKRSPNKGFAGMWECTGGSAVAGDDSLSAAVREVREETGLELDRAKGKLILSRRYTDTFVDNWLFEHEFELSDVKLLEGETCDAMLADKDTILELVKNEHFIPAEWIYDFFTFAEI